VFLKLSILLLLVVVLVVAGIQAEAVVLVDIEQALV
jgi:hypothetical protein